MAKAMLIAIIGLLSLMTGLRGQASNTQSRNYDGVGQEKVSSHQGLEQAWSLE